MQFPQYSGRVLYPRVHIRLGTKTLFTFRENANFNERCQFSRNFVNFSRKFFAKTSIWRKVVWNISTKEYMEPDPSIVSTDLFNNNFFGAFFHQSKLIFLKSTGTENSWELRQPSCGVIYDKLVLPWEWSFKDITKFLLYTPLGLLPKKLKILKRQDPFFF
jgi:hypothetical protein